MRKNYQQICQKKKCNIFEPDININQFCQQVREVLWDQRWRLYGEVYDKYNWENIFFVMIQSSVKRLILNNNNNSKILLQIQHVGFHELTTLSLYDNQINNIEALSFIDCPNIQILRLCENNICQIKILVKCSYNFLHLIQTNLNPIKDISRLSRLRLNQQRLRLHMKFGIAYHKQKEERKSQNQNQNFQQHQQNPCKSIGYIRSLSEVVKFDAARYELTQKNEDAYCQIYLGTAYQLWQSKIKQILQKRYYMIKFSEYQLF